jgi:hypothetical protein
VPVDELKARRPEGESVRCPKDLALPCAHPHPPVVATERRPIAPARGSCPGRPHISRSGNGWSLVRHSGSDSRAAGCAKDSDGALDRRPFNRRCR